MARCATAARTRARVSTSRRPLARSVREAALAGADVATVPPGVIKALAQHVLTDKGLEQFSKDWAATGQSIL